MYRHREARAVSLSWPACLPPLHIGLKVPPPGGDSLIRVRHPQRGNRSRPHRSPYKTGPRRGAYSLIYLICISSYKSPVRRPRPPCMIGSRPRAKKAHKSNRFRWISIPFFNPFLGGGSAHKSPISDCGRSKITNLRT